MSSKSYRKKKRLRNKADKLWGKAIMLKWGKQCIIDGCDNQAAHPHHFKPKGGYGHLRYDLDNGVPLCYSHHYRLHNVDPTISNKIATSKGKRWAKKMEEKGKNRPNYNIRTIKWYEDNIKRLKKFINDTEEE